MIPTVAYLQKKFNKYNKMFFDGVLPIIPIKLSKMRDIFGQFSWTYNKIDPNNTWNEHIKISVYYDLPEHMILNTLVHEMIHYYIHFMRMKDTSAHGRVFMGMARHINSISDFHITATENIDQNKLKIAGGNHKVYRIIKFTINGKVCYGRISVNFNYQYMIQRYNFKDVTIFESKDPMFDTWRESRKTLTYNWGTKIDNEIKKAMKKVVYRDAA